MASSNGIAGNMNEEEKSKSKRPKGKSRPLRKLLCFNFDWI